MVELGRLDIEFICRQIQMAEAHAAEADLASLLPNNEVPWGLRMVDGTFNNLDQTAFGAADGIFPRLMTPVCRLAEAGTSYTHCCPGGNTAEQPHRGDEFCVEITDALNLSRV